jgi:hypothetical protein
MFIKVLSFILIFNISLLACASGWDENEKSFLFLEKRELAFSNTPKNLSHPSVYNELNYKYQKNAKAQNLKEWKKYLNTNLDIKTIEKIVYKRDKLSLIKNEETLQYLNFVQDQEQHVVNHYYSKKQKKIKKEVLIKNALDKIDTVSSSWLKLRYFYLGLRLAHYSKINSLEIYNKYKYLLQTKDNTIVKDWIHAIYAGALVRNKKVALGVYEFSKLFDKSRINWYLSYYNFNYIKSDKQWQKLLFFAKTNDEKTKLYALRALNKNSNKIEELENIYKIDKNSKWFDFILYKALLNSQHYFDSHDTYVRNFQTKKFIEYLKDKKKDDMYMINLSLSYFNLYEKNSLVAEKIAKDLEEKYPGNHEVETLNYIIYLNLLKKIDLKTEDTIYEKLIQVTKNKDHHSNAIHDYTFIILEKLYKKQRNTFKEFLSQKVNYLNESSFNLDLLNQFKTFIQTKSKSKIEEHFKSKYTQQKRIKKDKDGFKLAHSLLHTQTVLLINNLKFQEAKGIKSEYLDTYIKFNPFNSFIKGNNRTGKKETYTIDEFLNKILIIKNELKKNPKSVMDNYLYANALFNLSYFGNSGNITSIYRSVYSFHNKKAELLKINESIKYYEKALKYAKNKEFKAKIIYMLAKSELSLFDINFAQKEDYYNSNFVDSYDVPRKWTYTKDKTYTKYINNNYGKYFDKLKKDYRNTKYYEEIIKECVNLRIYQKVKDK